MFPRNCSQAGCCGASQALAVPSQGFLSRWSWWRELCGVWINPFASGGSIHHREPCEPPRQLEAPDPHQESGWLWVEAHWLNIILYQLDNIIVVIFRRAYRIAMHFMWVSLVYSDERVEKLCWSVEEGAFLYCWQNDLNVFFLQFVLEVAQDSLHNQNYFHSSRKHRKIFSSWKNRRPPCATLLDRKSWETTRFHGRIFE